MADAKDAAIVDALSADSRAPLKQIAALVGLSASSVQERIARLVANGTIEGFSIRRGAVETTARAYMLSPPPAPNVRLSPRACSTLPRSSVVTQWREKPTWC